MDKAFFPLNLFPTREELKIMHDKYDTKNKDNVTLPEFIEMVTISMLALVLVIMIGRRRCCV